ncbi:MAG: TetR/AcrR family transcriptional regulator [Burkholderiaceae bacterium]|jgi:AcrR family transcriptional regulator|uniref:TetR/AcrR family transcriptional regulator n=1 Tax=Hylemonella sp. TaxID=2066020 RepID=UPI0035B195B5|nr:TetR/AcrR family transcriptional regulator [Burkholderiaceae bacterium]
MPVVPLSPKTPRSGARAAARDGRALHKGQQTKLAIIDAALGLAAQIGLEGLSIGVLAEVTGMSKSGVFAHFGSREELQISVVREYFARFEQEIFYPALEQPRGLPRLKALFSNWMKLVTVEIQSGCIFISGAVDFDDRPGPVRDALASSVKIWLAAVQRAVVQAKEEGHLAADADESQIGFEIHGLILAVHYEARFLKAPGSIARANKAFEQILARYGADGKAVKTVTSKAANVKAARKSASKTLTTSKQE